MKVLPERTAPKMLKNLRLKFIAVNMALAAIVLLVSFTTICVLDYQDSVSQVEESLRKSLRDAVEFSYGDHPRVWAEGDAPAFTESFEPPQIGGRSDRNQSDIPVAVYAYYSGADASMLMMGRSSATVSDDLLSNALEQACLSNDDSGYLSSSDLFFAKASSKVAGVTIVAFADGSFANGWQNLAWGLFGIGIIALIVLFAFNLLFSRWALRPVSDAWSQQRQFIADASHELKTPLTVILANNAILQREKSSTVESQLQWIESTRVEAERMQSLVTDMLDLARFDDSCDGKSAQGDVRDVDFSRLVEGEILTFESVAYEREIAWNSDVEAGLSVKGNEKELQRLVGILLDNSCKYTPEGGSVLISLARDGRFACMRVTNTGEAIPQDALEHLFERFYRVDKARTHGDGQDAPNGYGLGLSIAQQIAHGHGGTLEATSSEETGTTFTLRLPIG